MIPNQVVLRVVLAPPWGFRSARSRPIRWPCWLWLQLRLCKGLSEQLTWGWACKPELALGEGPGWRRAESRSESQGTRHTQPSGTTGPVPADPGPPAWPASLRNGFGYLRCLFTSLMHAIFMSKEFSKTKNKPLYLKKNKTTTKKKKKEKKGSCNESTLYFLEGTAEFRIKTSYLLCYFFNIRQRHHCLKPIS